MATLATSSTTTAPGLVQIDPIQGLVDYVNVIKPYHTKIFEVDFEFQYTDYVNTTVTDVMTISINESQSYITSDSDPAMGGPVAPNTIWYDPATDILYVRNQSGTGWIILTVNYQANINNTIYFNTNTLLMPNKAVAQITDTTADVSITEFAETICFQWGGDYTYTIVSSNPSANQVSISGNYINALMANDITDINGSFSYITAVQFDPSNDTTVITVNDSLPAIIGTSIIVEDIDITYWYQFSIISANPTPTLPSQSPEFAGVLFCATGGTPGTNEPICCTGTNQFVIPAGDFTSIFVPGVLLYITGTQTTNDGDYQVTLSSFIDGDTLVTVIPYGSAPGTLPFTLSQAGIVVANASSLAQTNTNAVITYIQPGVNNVPSVIVLGNATTSVQVGSIIQIQGSLANNGVYTAIYVQYEPIANTSTIGVQPALNSPSSAITQPTGGGIVVPYRFINEVMEGSYDNGGYDTGPYDQSAGSIIHTGP